MAHSVSAYVVAHFGYIWPVLSGILVLCIRTRTPEEWVALGEKQPRIQGLIKMLRGLGLDPVKAIEGLTQVKVGKVELDPRDGQIITLRAQLEAAQSELRALQSERASVQAPLR